MARKKQDRSKRDNFAGTAFQQGLCAEIWLSGMYQSLVYFAYMHVVQKDSFVN